MAHQGTISSTRVGEIAVETQLALLRVIQDKQFERVGGSEPISADVRIIAATNRDLSKAVASGTFRSNLFYRLNVFPIEVPPLRQRAEDVPAARRVFREEIRRRSWASASAVLSTSGGSSCAESYDWPGNIRELQNVVERSVILCTGDTLTIDEALLSGAAPFGPGHRRLCRGAL